MRKIYGWVLALVVLVIVVATPGCAHVEPTSTSQPVIQITDALGRALEFSELPKNIVITGRATQLLLDTLYLFPEAKERITHLEYRSQNPTNFLPLVDPLAEQKMGLERDAGVEQIAPLKPDVVIMKSYLKTDLGDPIEQVGIKVLYLDLETPEAFYREVEMLGIFFGNPLRSQEIVEYYQQRVQSIETRTQSIDDDHRPGVLVLQYSVTGDEVAFKVPPATWLQTRMVKSAGGNPVWTADNSGEGWTVVSLEQIAAWNPEMVFLVDYKGNAPEVVARLSRNEAWQSLPAMAAGKVYPFPCDFLSWDQADSRWILGQEWLAKMIQPELFSDLDLRDETISFYKQMYGLSDKGIEEQVLTMLADEVSIEQTSK